MIPAGRKIFGFNVCLKTPVKVLYTPGAAI